MVGHNVTEANGKAGDANEVEGGEVGPTDQGHNRHGKYGQGANGIANGKTKFPRRGGGTLTDSPK